MTPLGLIERFAPPGPRPRRRDPRADLRQDIELLTAFSAIRDEDQRRAVIDLARALARRQV